MDQWDMNETPEIGLLQKEVERRVNSAIVRSRLFRAITVSLVVLWSCVAALVILRVKEQRLKAQRIQLEEQQKLAAEMKRHQEENQRLSEQAENARLASIYVASGVFKATHGNGNGALADYKKALSYDPDSAVALSYEGYLRLRMGQTQKAEEMLGKAVQIDPSWAWYRYNFALALWANGKHKEAVAQVQEILRLDSTFKSTIAKDYQFHSFRSDPVFRGLIKP